MNFRNKFFITTLAICACTFSSAQATPMIWESDFGAELVDLTGRDDEESLVTLSFNFNFAGVNYTDFFVGTNGAVQAAQAVMGGAKAGNDGIIDYDMWDDMEEFLDDGTPIFSPFNTDLTLGSNGTIHFNDFGDRAVFTWNEVGTVEENDHLLTFQMQLLNDGSIIFAYNGLLDNVGEDFLTSLDQGILVGISESNDPQGLTPSDLNGGPFTTGTTAFELWCYDTVDSCNNRTGPLINGPLNSAFDLDQTNIIFTPRGVGNFDVTSLSANQIPNPASITLLGLGLLGLVARRRK